LARLRELWNDLGKRGRIAVTVGFVLLVFAVPALAIGPIARSRVEKQALARGLEVDVGRVRPSFGGLWLLDLDVASREAGRVTGNVDAVFVPLGGGPVKVHGARVALHGTPAEIRRALRTRVERSEPAKAGRRIEADGISVRWTAIDHRKFAIEAWGVAVSRGDGERLRADLVRVSGPGTAASARGLEALPLPGGHRFGSLKLAALDAALDLDRLRSAAPEVAPSGVAQPTPPPPSPPPALNVAALVGLLKQEVPEGATVTVDAARLDVRFGAEQVGVGPSRFAFRRTPAELTLELSPAERSAAGVTPLALRGHWPLPEGLPTLEVEGGPVSLGVLGLKDGQLGLQRTRDATIEAHLKLELAAGGVVRASGSGAIVNLAIQRRELGPRELRGIKLAFRGSGEVALDGSLVRIGDSEFAVGDVKFSGKLEFERYAAGVRIRGDGGVPLASCDAMLASLPAALIDELAGVRLSGTFGLTTAVAYDSARPDDLEVKLKVANDCRVVDAPAPFSPERFKRPWTREVKAPDGSSVLTQSGPGTADYTPYARISRYMETAVLVCEDGGFFHHRGFDFRAIEKALRADILAGRFVRGASTISMQLAKNLYLSRDKTLARKVQEALLTMLLEERLSKQELMELYLNIVELGPGIYGVGQAAEHYFAKPASELSLGQSLYLASILPDPTRQHFTPEGAVTPRWSEYLKKLMNIARKVKLITDEELAQGLLEEVAFRQPGSGSLPAFGGGDPAGDVPGEADFDSIGP
jgi:hypothetical protein